ncbi:MAG: DUF1080 domain-containing protein [Acidobacteriia bacterium]|nr:DUF1080 domain-containing protein [Terriglobia bacterium]
MRLPIVLLIAASLPAAENWLPLFNGVNLDEFEIRSGKAAYKLDNGEIVGTTVEGSPNTFLCTRKTYGDFLLAFEVKTDPRLNSGVQLRSHAYDKPAEVVTMNQGARRVTHQPGRVYGYQVEVATEKSGASGGIYDEARRGWIHNTSNDPGCKAAFKDNQWNHYYVEARRDRIRTWVNHIPCADVVDSLDLDGFIGLQVHQFQGGSPAEVRWRNLRIAELGRHSWKPIFDGKSLNGWNGNGGGEWKITDGALHGAQATGSTERGFLISADDYSNFTLRLQYKAVRGNSGVFFRMGEPPWSIRGSLGYEVEVDPTRDPGGLQHPGARGWLVHTGPVAETPHVKPTDWNTMTISAHGRRIVVHVNGVKMSEVVNDPGPLSGRLALQLNPRNDLEVFYKDLAILSPGK